MTRDILVPSLLINGAPGRVPHVLVGGGVPQEIVAQTPVYGANKEYKDREYKQNRVREFANAHPEIKYHHVFDDDPYFLNAYRALIPEFEAQGKILTVTQVDPKDHLFLEEIRKENFPVSDQNALSTMPKQGPGISNASSDEEESKSESENGDEDEDLNEGAAAQTIAQLTMLTSINNFSTQPGNFSQMRFHPYAPPGIALKSASFVSPIVLSSVGSLSTAMFSSAPPQVPNINAPDVNGYTALHHAVWNGDFEQVKSLVEKGASINFRDRADKSVLDKAVYKNHIEIVRFLLSQPNISVQGGARPIENACRSGNREITQLLVDKHITSGDKNFSNLNLSGISFKGKDLRGANFNGTNLSGADLSGAKLGGASFSRTDLSNVNLNQVQLDDAVLANAKDMKNLKTELVEIQNTDNFLTCAKWLDPDPACVFSHESINQSRLIQLDGACRVLRSGGYGSQSKELFELRKILLEHKRESFSVALSKWKFRQNYRDPVSSATAPQVFFSPIQEEISKFIKMLHEEPEKYLQPRQLQARVLPEFSTASTTSMPMCGSINT